MGASIHTIPADHILWDIVEEHLDEAAFLFGQWERALQSPVLDLERVADRVEARLLAHLDGLLVAGEPAIDRLLLPALTEGDRGEAFAAAATLLASGDKKHLGLVMKALPEAGKRPLPGIQRALELSERGGFEAELMPLLESPRPELRALALEVLSFRRFDPGFRIVPLLNDPDPRVCRAMVQAVGRLALPRYLPNVVHHLNSADPELRDQVLMTGLVLGSRDVWATCRTLAGSPESSNPTVLTLLAILGGPQELPRLFGALEARATRKAALRALGCSGLVQAADRCLELMSDKDLAGLAGEAFVGITGVDLAGERLLAAPGPRQEAEEPVPLEQEDLEADLALDPDEGLPAPDAAAVAAWWAKRRGELNARSRYVLGRPVSEATLLWGLEVATMRRRPALALELALQTRGRLQIETRALTPVQRQLMRKAGVHAAAQG